ncbi:MAG: FecR domain-containing protein, partial [Acidobacteria bacterium]|nr:FecR domain-containing protein [Acidobacteriota bacterium]
MKRTILTTFVLGAMVGFMSPVAAQQETEAGPALGVARISLTNGDVSTRRGDAGDWVAATVNAPVVEGDTLATGSGSRAEIQLDYSNLVRLDAETEIKLTNLGERNFRVQLFNGRMTYSELKGGEADVDIETPHAAIRPHRNGRYEIETRVGETVIQVRKGEAEVFTSKGTETLARGRMLVLRDGPDGVEVRLSSDEPRGDWDRWNEDRDDRLADVESYRYVSSSVVGAGDLDGSGDWRYVSGYGHTWYPRVAAGWAPYRDGRWAWAPYYGWTWVGYEPWGWAPYHYGRWWNHPSYGWGWYPGDRHYRQAWRPALVGFFGYSGRSGWSVGVGFGSVGWIPLAPGERYHPWYGRRGYGGRNSTIVVDNSVNIYNDYRNARVNNGVTVVDAGGFSRGRLDNVRSLNRNELARASAVRGNVPVVPERQAQGTILRNIRTSASNGQPGNARRSTFSRSGVRGATSPRQASFAEQRQQVATSVRQIRTQGAVNSPRANTATTRTSPRVTGSVRLAGDVRSSGRAGTATSRSGAASPRSSQTYSAPDRGTSGRLQPRNNRIDSGASVRGSRATTSAPQRTGTTRSSDRGTIQRRNNATDNGPVIRDSRSSGTSSAPARSQSMVNRNSSSRSGSQVDRGSSQSPRVGRSDSSSRIPRATTPSSPARSRVPAIQSSPSRSPRTSQQPSSQR